MNLNDYCILNAGNASWAFEALADQLSRALWIDVAETPRRHTYLLLAEDDVAEALADPFVPFANMELAADKRALARVFAEANVPTPETRLIDTLDDARRLALAEPATEWCLKYPTSCGASGHRLLADVATLIAEWPWPLVVQEFIRLPQPEVYRLYAAGGHLFGWVARRFPDGMKASPWVAHARGARYERAGDPPPGAIAATRAALAATGLLDSFGCADLLCRPTGEWLVLEVGTDGMFNHVDRELGLPDVEREIERRIAEAFWSRLGEWRPWGDGPWRPRVL